MIPRLVPFREAGQVSFFEGEQLHLLPLGFVRGQRKISSGLCDNPFQVISDDANMSAFQQIVAFVHDDSHDTRGGVCA